MRGLLATTVLLLAMAAPAQAFESVLQDDDLLLHSGPETADATLRELRGLGVDRVRVTVNWAVVAPGLSGEPDPARLAPHDHVLRSARALGIEVLLTLSAGQGAARPDPAAFGRFVEALGRRWDGRDGRPAARAWSLWNEPNWGGLLQPQWVAVRAKPKPGARRGRTPAMSRRGRAAAKRGGAAATAKRKRPKPRTRWVLRAPRIYRALHRAGTAALARTGHGADTILLGETAPRGDRRKGATRASAPVDFLASLLCLDPVRLRPLRGSAAREAGCQDFARNGPLAATGYAHHPYGVRDAPGVPAASRRDAGLADAARLTAVLDAAARHGRLPAGLPLWWTEHGYETNPPDPRRGQDPERQARWLADAERIARATPRVVAHTQFLLRDTPLDARFPATDRRHFRTYQSGLQFADGTAKPSLAAYRLPLSLPERVAPGAPLPVWGLVRGPADARGTEVALEFAPDGSDAFTEVLRVTVADPEGALAAQAPPPAASGRFRLTWQPPAPPAPPRDESATAALGPPPPTRPPAPPPVRSHPVGVAVG